MCHSVCGHSFKITARCVTGIQSTPICHLQEDGNAVIVLWGGPNGAQDPRQQRAASTTRVVGADIGDAITNLIVNANGSPDRMWCSGASLGSHVCSSVGKRVRDNGLGLISRITG